jgi:hypothetical protein
VTMESVGSGHFMEVHSVVIYKLYNLKGVNVLFKVIQYAIKKTS